MPHSIYSSTELTGAGVQGFSLSGFLASIGAWSVSYDLYGGALDLQVTNVSSKVLAPQNLRPGGTLVTSSEKIKYIVGGRIIANTPLDGLDIRLSGYGTPVTEDNGPRYVVGPSIQYIGEKLSIRGEYFFIAETGGGESDRESAHAAYLEAAYFLTEHIQIGARAEIYHLNLFGNPDSSLLDHRELAATLDYWFVPDLVIKLSVHGIDGNRFSAGQPSSTTYCWPVT